MTDYSQEIYMTRGAAAGMLTQNDEQFIYVITEAVDYMNVAGMIEDGCEPSPQIHAEGVALKLRLIADYLEGK